ncbi:hypothetical protein H0E84_18170 [Luteimonas sp. SJ-92]|uniref:DUF4410 domain-containing protein n=1 Tax=Luteimonas salinisoli TaxID=2752307 RepID=A0A853JHF6_9GAMM|nr:hypothetical protein [Luteimonas salinisoli]NZA28305.1 hypothetical protein [Luteimonas salinisoli]
MGLFKGPRVVRAVMVAFALSFSLSGCLSTKTYVDPTLPTVSRTDLRAPANPRSANVLFEFRTKGNANARATQEVRPMVIQAVEESGLFSSVSDTASVPAGSQLKVVIDNVPVTDNAAAKGFGTGLTLGLAGSMVTDGYVCTVSYTADGTTTETVVNHALHTTIGNHGGPDGLAPMPMQQALTTLVHQMVFNALKDFSDRRLFEEQ